MIDGKGAREGLDLSHAEVRLVSGYQAVLEVLRREVALGRLLPGDRLPAERALAEQLGVSRETVRQALRVLEGSGLVEVSRGASGGTFIRDVPIDPEALRAELRAEQRTIIQHHEYRSVLEESAARFAAGRRTAEHLDQMRRAQELLRGAETMPSARAADTLFHLAIAQASANEFLSAAVESARAQGFRVVDALPFEFLTESSLTAHDRILDAIATGDADAAAAAMREHIRVSIREFEEITS